MATHDDHLDSDFGQERSPWSKPSVLLSGMFILALLAAGVVFFVVKGGGSTQHHHAQAARGNSTPAATTPAGTTTAAGKGECSLASGSQSIPSASPPAGTSWNQVGGMEAPQAPSTLGPGATSGGYDVCFAHNPSGALLAAINLWAEGTTTSNASALMQHLAVGAPANLGNNSNLDTSGPVQLAGYKYDSYSASQAVVSVVLQGPQGKLLSIVTPMRWTGSDWKYVFPPQGMPAFEAISSLNGYVSWSDF